MSTDNIDNLYRKMHKMATYFLTEIGEMGVVDITITSTLFDTIFHESVQNKIFLYPSDGSKDSKEAFSQLPIDTITINVQGRPVVIRKQTKKAP